MADEDEELFADDEELPIEDEKPVAVDEELPADEEEPVAEDREAVDSPERDSGPEDRVSSGFLDCPNAIGLLSAHTRQVSRGTKKKYFQMVCREDLLLFIMIIRRFKSD